MNIEQIIMILEAGKTLAELAKKYKDTVSLGTETSPLLAKLISTGKRTWTYIVGREEEIPKKRKDVAIAVQINMFIAQQVKEYLEKHKIDANMILITNSKDARRTSYLDNNKPEEWREVINDFVEEIRNTERAMGATTFYLFMATPAALAMALGCALGRQRRAYLYNWDPSGGTYWRVSVLPSDIQ